MEIQLESEFDCKSYFVQHADTKQIFYHLYIYKIFDIQRKFQILLVRKKKEHFQNLQDI